MQRAVDVSEGGEVDLREVESVQVEVIDLRVDEARTQPVLARSLPLRRWVGFLVVSDLSAALLSAGLAIMLRFNGSPGRVNGVPYVLLLPFFPLAWVLTMWLSGTYDKSLLVSGSEEFRRTANGAVWLLGVIAAASFALHAPVSRAVIAASLLWVSAMALGTRYVIRVLVQARLRDGEHTLHRALVVANEAQADRLARHMQRNPQVGFAVAALHPPTWARTTSVEERVTAIFEHARESNADTIAVTGSSRFDSAALRRLAWSLEGTGMRLLVVPDLTDLAGPRIRVRPVDGLPLLHVEEPGFHGPKLVLKRAIDLVGGVALTFGLTPLFVLIAVAVLLGSGRPILYSQDRVGLRGKHFRMIKFRTMLPHADQLEERSDEGDPVRRKPQEDPRVTRVGRILRRSSLDELPQLLNVIGGSMSLVGPRPHRPVEVAEYCDEAKRRLLIKPGLTGVWQVSGRAALSWDEAVRLDLKYVENWSIGGDALLLLRTLRAVLTSQGAF